MALLVHCFQGLFPVTWACIGSHRDVSTGGFFVIIFVVAIAGLAAEQRCVAVCRVCAAILARAHARISLLPLLDFVYR